MMNLLLSKQFMVDIPSSKFSQAQALFLDFDGTLVDSVPDLARAINLMLKDLGRTGFSVDEIHQWVGNGAEQLVARALSGAVEIDPDLKSDFIKQNLKNYTQYYERDICVDTSLYPQVKETLKALQADNWRLAIITNKTERFVEPILKGLGLDGLFHLIVGGDSLPERKPHPEPLLYAASHFSLVPSQCVMVGDSRNDILAAKAAGIPSVGVTYGYNYGEPIAVYEPDLVIDNFAELLTVLPRA